MRIFNVGLGIRLPFGAVAALAVALLGCSGDEGGSGSSASSDAASASAGASSTGASMSGGTGGTGGAGQGGAGGAGQGGGGAGQGGAGGSASAWGPDQCPAPGPNVGYEIGDQLADIVVKTCDGADYSLTELCGANGLFIFAAHGWCPLCKSVSSQQEAIHDSFAGQGLASVNIVVETGLGDPPDADYCKLWRDQYGQEDVITLYDPTGAVLALWPGGSSSLSAYVDDSRIIVSKLVHNSDVQAIKAEIQKALDQ
jgi:hypothetical protein